MKYKPGKTYVNSLYIKKNNNLLKVQRLYRNEICLNYLIVSLLDYICDFFYMKITYRYFYKLLFDESLSK